MKSYGRGEFEFRDDENRSSLWDLRLDFLREVVRLRYEIVSDLFRIYDPAWRDAAGLSNLPDDEVFYEIFIAMFQGNPRNLDLSHKPFETTYFCFQRLIESEQWPVNLDKFIAPTFDTDDLPFKVDVVDWESITRLENSHDFCQRIEGWGIENNLNADWIFEFIVTVFQLLYLRLTKRRTKIEISEVDPRLASDVRYGFNSRVSAAIRDAFFCLEQNRVVIPVYAHAWDTFPEDEFRFPKRNPVVRTIWYPLRVKRGQFIRQTVEMFNRKVSFLSQLTAVPTSIIQRGLEQYCLAVREGRTEPYRIAMSGYDDEIVVFEGTWDRSQDTEEKFIENSTKRIEERFEALSRELKRLTSIKDETLRIEISLYCDVIGKNGPVGVDPVPSKYRPEHLSWLVESQVPPFVEYNDLAIKYLQNGDAMRKAVNTLVKSIGLPPRNRYKGRPKGSKNRNLGSAGRAKK